MKSTIFYATIVAAAIAGTIIAFLPLNAVSAKGPPVPTPASTWLINANENLNGFVGPVYPFVDTTPNIMTEAHIAITDASDGDCVAGASPANIVILAGNPDDGLASVMGGTGLGLVSDEDCVFHVTIHPGETYATGVGTDTIPATLTDIVILNGSGEPLDGSKTITVTASVVPGS